VGGKPAAGNPIDTRIAEPRRGPPSNPKPIDAKKIGVVGVPSTPSPGGVVPGPLGLAHGQNSMLRPPAVSNKVIAPLSGAGLTRNAIGTPTQSSQAAAMGIARKGTPTAPGAGTQAGMARTSEGVVTRAAGGNPAAGNAAVLAGRINGSAVGRVSPPSPAAAANHGVVNGTAMGRPISGPASIGGAARNIAAGINGTGYRAKRP
jgi:hypothetical protein